MSTRKVIELLLQLKSAKNHGKNYIKIKRHLLKSPSGNLITRIDDCCHGYKISVATKVHFVINDQLTNYELYIFNDIYKVFARDVMKF